MAAGFLAAFLNRALHEPSRPFVILYKDKKQALFTHKDILEKAWNYAAVLREHGAKPGEVVLISLATSPDLFGAFLGTLLVGCIPSFMAYPTVKQDPVLFWTSHDALFKHIGSPLIITFPENRKSIETNIAFGLRRVVTTDEVLATGQASFSDAYPWRLDDLACLQHSSGTTGLKKGVMLTFAKIEAQIDAYVRAIGLTEADTIVSWLPLYHDMGFVACFLLPLAMGNPLVMLDPFEWLADPLFLFELIDRHGGRYTWLPNFAFNHLVNCAFDDSRKTDLSRIKALINSSEPCKTDTFRSFAERFASWGLDPNSLQVCYALAEAVFAVSQTPIGKHYRSLPFERSLLQENFIGAATDAANATEVMSVGRPLREVEVAIFDDEYRLVEGGTIGQIGLRGPFIFDGYYRDPERTKKAFHDGFYLTGDRGFQHEDDLFVLGRQDDLIIVLGKNFLAHEIEQCVCKVTGVKGGRAVAFGVYSESIGSEEVFVVVEKDAPERDEIAIRNGIRSLLASTIGLVPKAILVVDAGWIVKSTSGKISRRENRIKYLSREGALPVALPERRVVE